MSRTVRATKPVLKCQCQTVSGHAIRYKMPLLLLCFYKVLCAPGYNEVMTSKVDFLHSKVKIR